MFLAMTRFQGGIGRGSISASEFITGVIQMLLWLFVLGTICRCILIILRCMSEGKEMGELFRILKKHALAAILAGCSANILGIIERAFR